MDKLSRVLFKVYTVNADIFGFFLAVLLKFDRNKTVYTKRQIKLRYLVRLGQVWIKIILPVKGGKLIDIAAESKPRFYGVLYSSLVYYGKRARHTGAYGTAAGVFISSEFGGTGTENL